MAAAVTSPEEMPGRPTLRMYLVGGLVLALFAVLVLRLWSLQIVNHRQYAAQVSTNQVRTVVVPAPRGVITDRSGTMLVGNTVENEIVLSRAEAAQHPAIIGQVAALVGQTPKQVEAALADVQYSPYQPVPVMQNAPPATVTYLQEHQSEYPGVSVQRVSQRSYPQVLGTVTPAAQTLGYVGAINGTELDEHPNQGYTESSNIGKSGLEEEYEQYLRGKNGEQELSVNAQGSVVGILKNVAPVQGDTLVTNLDLGLQEAVENALSQDVANDAHTVDSTTGNYPKPNNAAAVVMNINTGQVLAMASYPSYSLNDWVGGISDAAFQALSASGAENNYAIDGLYTPGSTFKLATATAALNDGLISPTDTYDDTGTYTVPGCTGDQCTFHGDDANGLGPVNVTQALTASDDIYFYNLGVSFWEQQSKYGQTPIQNAANSLGMGELTGIDVPGEAQGRVDSQAVENELHAEDPQAYPNQVNWNAGDNLEMAFGQGGTVITPIEMAQAYATFANGGTRYQPEVANAVESPGGKILKAFAPKVTGHVAYTPTNYAAMLAGFEGVVNSPSGTAYGTFQADAHLPSNYMVAGKTGTADVGAGQEPNAWFVSFGPEPDPQYVIAVVVNQAGYGAQAAAPAVANIWNYLYANPVPNVSYPSPSHPASNTPPPTVPPAGTPTPTAPATPATSTTTPGG